MTDELLIQLKIPFDPSIIEWRAGSTNKDNTKALALAYAPARAYMERLDEVLGLDWQDDYKTAPDGGVLCGISILIDGQWVTRWDGAGNTNIEAVKGGLSDSFKRACVKWGVGRYLYNIPAQWVKCEQRKGQSVALLETPSIDGKKAQPKKQETQEPNKKQYTRKDIYNAVVEAELSKTVFSAKNALAKCTVEYNTPEKAIAWMSIYRDWRELGIESKDAAIRANKGEEA